MMKSLIIPILLSSVLMACGPCADTNTCAEEWYDESLEEQWKENADCIDQKEYNACPGRNGYAVPPAGYSIEEYCKEQATYRCRDRKSTSSQKMKWKKGS